MQSQADSLVVSWAGERGQQLRATFAIQQDQPLIRELAAKKSSGELGCSW